MPETDYLSSNEKTEKLIYDHPQKWLRYSSVTGLVRAGNQAGENTRKEIARLEGPLASPYFIVEDGERPPYPSPPGTLRGGMLLGVVSLLYWAKYMLRPRRTLKRKSE